ncbi:MAG: DUF131 domain-containing protein [Thermoplasmata archaeon]
MSGSARSRQDTARTRRPLSGLLAPLLIGVGAALVLAAVASGAATVSLVVIVPVVTGSSALFGLGILSFVAGVLLLPFTLPAAEDRPKVPTAPAAAGGGTEVGGLLLLGPLPIFFGSARAPPRWVYFLAVGFGGALFVLAVLFFAGVLVGGL